MASYQVSIFSFYTEREDVREENASAGNSNISSVLHVGSLYEFGHVYVGRGHKNFKSTIIILKWHKNISEFSIEKCGGKQEGRGWQNQNGTG